jgi:hypothetical protein
MDQPQPRLAWTMPVLTGAWTHDCCPDLPTCKAAQNSKIFKIVISLHSSFIKVNRIRTKTCRIEGRVWGCGTVANEQEVFPEREYVHFWTGLVVEFS